MKSPTSVLYKNKSSYPQNLSMTSLFLEKSADHIYEELQDKTEDNLGYQDEEYREDRMEQMISRYGY